MSVTKDERKGEITINGKVGRALFVFDLLGKTASMLMIPLLYWVFVHHGEHENIKRTTNAIQTTDVAAHQHEELRREFNDRLALEVRAMRQELTNHTGEFREFRGEIRSSIRRLLED